MCQRGASAAALRDWTNLPLPLPLNASANMRVSTGSHKESVDSGDKMRKAEKGFDQCNPFTPRPSEKEFGNLIHQILNSCDPTNIRMRALSSLGAWLFKDFVLSRLNP
jgi:hypothetical protein